MGCGALRIGDEMSLRVICGIEPGLDFRAPHRVLRPRSIGEALAALQTCEEAHRSGFWIAGYLSYEFGASLHGATIADSSTPLLALGIFDAPARASACIPEADVRISALLPAVTQASYDASIASILRSIYDGDVYQVNFTIPYEFSMDGDAKRLWETVARTTGARYQAYVEDEDRRILSWSPELFLSFEGSRVATGPMKGTAPVGDADALQSAKNRAEHVMIVDLLRNDLRRIATGVTVEALAALEAYPTFLTLTSTVAGTLEKSPAFEEIVRAMFPCGSVTGAPKRSAIERIALLETSPRTAYCGTIGYLSPAHRGWWNVAIRTAQVRGSRGVFHAGGGIVCDSTAGGEWNEIATKATFLRLRAEPLELLESFASNAAPGTIEAHLVRLASSAEAFDIAYDPLALARAVNEACRAAHKIVRLRLRADGTFSIGTEQLEIPHEPVAICVSRECVTRDDPFLRHKTAWRPAHERASAYARVHGCFDALVQNEDAQLTEGSRTNLFIEIDGALWTPPLKSGALPGILRSRIVSEGRAHERILTLRDLISAREVFVGNSARGLLRARLVNTRA